MPVMKTISVKLPEELDQELAARAEREGTTKSTLIREAIEKHVLAKGGPSQGTFLDLAADLIGSLEGPGDLSWNKEHLRDFGR